MKRATIAMEDERMKFLTFKPLDEWRNQKASQIMETIGMTSPHLSQEQEEHEWPGEFSPGWSHQPGLKVSYLSRLVAPTRTKYPPTIPTGTLPLDPGLILLLVPGPKLAGTNKEDERSFL
jgi:hypothetical protein